MVFLENAKLIFDPATEIIDLSKYADNIVSDTLGSIPCDSITFNVVGGEEKYYIIDTFEQFKAINTNDTTLDSNSRYIMRQNVDCSKAQTENRTIATDEDLDDIPESTEGEYDSGRLVKVKNDNGVYPIDNPEATIRYDIYRKTPYTTDYEPSDEPITNPGYTEDSEAYDDIVDGFSQQKYADDLKYWHIYNYQGFWINEFSGKFNGNGFELQNCYVNKVTNNTGVFLYLANGGKLSNIGATGSVLGHVCVGGLVGRNYSLITNSCSTCSVIGYGTQVGGLVGNNHSSSIVSNSYSTGSVTGYAGSVGGLVGVSVYSLMIINSYSRGSVIGYSTSVGGLVGQNSTSSIITNSYWDIETSGQSTSAGGAGVVGLTTEEMKDIDNYLPEWDFNNIWGIDLAINDGYPYLRAFNASYTNWLSNYKIINIPPEGTDAYIEFPDNINFTTTINGVETIITDFFNREKNTDIYNDVCRGSVHYNSTNPHLWHLTELNTNTLLEYINYDYRYLFFVKNGFRSDGYLATIREIFLYNKPMNTYDEYSKIKTYLGLNGLYQNIPTFDGNDLTFESIKRAGSTVVNEIDDSKDGKLIYNPLTDIIDLEKWGYDPSLPESEKQLLTIKSVVTTRNEISEAWDETIEDVNYTIIRNFADFQDINNATSGFYIMANDIDCSASQTMRETIADEDFDSSKDYSLEDNLLTVVNYQNNRYIKTPYVDNYKAGKTPEDTDMKGQKYWEKYNYRGFWINIFRGVFSGNGFELQNCYVNKDNAYTGVFSFLNDGKLSNIGVTGSVIGYGDRVGGLVGYNYSSSIITNSYSTVSVIGYSTSVGGLVGYNYSSSITNSYSTGSVIGYSTRVGGLVGGNSTSSTITNSYSTGSVIGYSTSVGGLVGYNYSSTIINSYWDIETSGQSASAGGIGLTTIQMKDIDNYLPEWDFTNTWTIDDGYPYLRMQVDNLANPISNSRIVNNYDGLIEMPNIPIEGYGSLFDKSNTSIYLPDEDEGFSPYDKDNPFLWHISELTTENIQKHLKQETKFLWFVKNNYNDDDSSKGIVSIFSYSKPITNESQRQLVQFYLNESLWNTTGEN